MIKNIIFDCGGVLTNCIPTEYVKALGLPKEDEDKLFDAIYHSKAWERSDYGEFETAEDMINAFIEENKPLESLIRVFFSPGWMMFYYPYQIGQEFLIRMKKEGYHVYVLSNYAKDGFMYCYDTYECFRYVDGYVCSADVHMIKPDPRIFQYLVDKFSLNKEECVFLDDRQINVDASIRFGIKAFLYEHNVDEIYKKIKSYDKD